MRRLRVKLHVLGLKNMVKDFATYLLEIVISTGYLHPFIVCNWLNLFNNLIRASVYPFAPSVRPFRFDVLGCGA